MRTIRDIIKSCGGPAKVGRAVGLKKGVGEWPRIGIPDRHWPIMIALDPTLTPDEMLAANVAARQPPRRADASGSPNIHAPPSASPGNEPAPLLDHQTP